MAYGQWQLECPRGHVTVRRRRPTFYRDREPSWYCETCEDHYETVTDKKTRRRVPA